VTFSLADHWVWDFWIADDGETFHLFYLHAPMSLGDPELRHRNAVIGHATSVDLTGWVDHGRVIGPGRAGEADATASWTGSVVRDDRQWWMFYTGSRFLAADRAINIESIVAATSRDLNEWSTLPGAVLQADSEWYEVLDDGTWHEQAWRDPWVVRDPSGVGWHMLITARAKSGGDSSRDRGVVGHAFSADLVDWTALPPLSAPGSGFAHLEVIQWVEIEGRAALIFSCDTAHLAGAREASRDGGGIWAVPAPALGQHIALDAAARLTDDRLYAGRAVQARDGRWMLLGFENVAEHAEFVGRLSDPSPLRWDADGQLRVDRPGAAA
jgi:beta-fructofuranosidase